MSHARLRAFEHVAGGIEALRPSARPLSMAAVGDGKGVRHTNGPDRAFGLP